MSDEVRTMMERFIGVLPHAQALEMVVVEADPATVTLAIPYAEKLIGDPVSRVVHGGVISALLDTACGGAVISHPRINGMGTATLDLRIDYMRPAPPERRLFAQAECYNVTRSVAFVRASAWCEGCEDKPVATATGAFTAALHGTKPIQ